MMVGFLLANRFPLLLWWGPHFCQLYNDPYRPVLGTKHPNSLGQPAGECWPEIWHIIGPLIERPFRGGEPTYSEDLSLEPNRHGFLEETHFTVAYSPVPDDTVASGIGRVLATVHEITEKVVGERRIMAGAKVYVGHCAMCHGAPGQPEPTIARDMYPFPTQLFHGKGVTNNPAWWSYWKVTNGIRLSAMPPVDDSLHGTRESIA